MGASGPRQGSGHLQAPSALAAQLGIPDAATAAGRNATQDCGAQACQLHNTAPQARLGRRPACISVHKRAPAAPVKGAPADLPKAALSIRCSRPRTSLSLSARGESRRSRAAASPWLRTRGEPGSEAPLVPSVGWGSADAAAAEKLAKEKVPPAGVGLVGAAGESKERRAEPPKGDETGAARRARMRAFPLPPPPGLLPTLPPTGMARPDWAAAGALPAAAARAGRELLAGRAVAGRPQRRFGCGASTSP